MTTRGRIAVYNLYWTTFGGGEQVAGSFAESLARHHDVTLLGPKPVDVTTVRERLGVDLSGCRYQKVVDDVEAGLASADFDVFINTTYRSVAHNQSPVGVYYVHFPQPPDTTRQRLQQRLCRVGAAMLSRARVRKLRRLHAAFERRTARMEWVASYSKFLANSTFTAEWVTRLWHVPADLLYPPVRPEVVPGDKSPVIAAVGRFFDPKFGHCKKQLDLLHAFVELVEPHAADWRLVLVGGADAASREYALSVRRGAQHHAVDVRLNAPRSVVHSTLAAASVFWHGAGFGEDPLVHPERFEHFGIAVVEAMAAGAVPIVFGAAGPAEIVRDGVDGFHWHTTAELALRTQQLIADPHLRVQMSASAIERASEFSSTVFAARVHQLAAAELS